MSIANNRRQKFVLVRRGGDPQNGEPAGPADGPARCPNLPDGNFYLLPLETFGGPTWAHSRRDGMDSTLRPTEPAPTALQQIDPLVSAKIDRLVVGLAAAADIASIPVR